VYLRKEAGSFVDESQRTLHCRPGRLSQFDAPYLPS
jgi:hypothetical protein